MLLRDASVDGWQGPGSYNHLELNSANLCMSLKKRVQPTDTLILAR